MLVLVDWIKRHHRAFVTNHHKAWAVRNTLVLLYCSTYMMVGGRHLPPTIALLTWSMLNWSFDIKITNILRFEKKCRFLVKSLYFGPNPIVNEVISRFWAFRSNFLYDFTWLAPNLYEIMNKVPVLALKWTFWFWPPPGLNLDLNLTPPHNLTCCVKQLCNDFGEP